MTSQLVISQIDFVGLAIVTGCNVSLIILTLILSSRYRNWYLHLMLITFSLLFGLFVFGLYYIYYSWMEYDEFIASPTPVEIGVTAAYMAHFFPALFMYARSAGIFLENNKNAWHSRREKERRKE